MWNKPNEFVHTVNNSIELNSVSNTEVWLDWCPETSTFWVLSIQTQILCEDWSFRLAIRHMLLHLDRDRLLPPPPPMLSYALLSWLTWKWHWFFHLAPGMKAAKNMNQNVKLVLSSITTCPLDLRSPNPLTQKPLEAFLCQNYLCPVAFEWTNYHKKRGWWRPRFISILGPCNGLCVHLLLE